MTVEPTGSATRAFGKVSKSKPQFFVYFDYLTFCENVLYYNHKERGAQANERIFQNRNEIPL